MVKNKALTGTNLAGMSTTRERVKDDFYATPTSAVEAILNEISLEGSILEPAAGQGHISKVLKTYYPNSEIVSTDLVQREGKFGIPIQGDVNFLTYEFDRKFDNIITNPPFNLSKEFIERALSLSNKKVIIFAKIQLLEGNNRRMLFDNSPLKYVYVFTKRVNPLRNGEELDEKGKPWSSTMCFAWFVWEHGYEGEPIVRWL
ncbi:MAG: class I SAM-dependent methyltransferase [Lachnospiraceae bacterium]|nr:class I SAM-dependent methyltransferase [Lachnospiraceae bacterium]